MTDQRPQLFRALWVLPVTAPPIRDGAVLVDTDGRIAAVGPGDAIRPPDGCRVEELGDAILLPGLVNVHAHPELAMFRGALEDLGFSDWILRLVGAKRSHLQDDDYLAAATWTCGESLRAGITTIGATEASGAAAHAMIETGMRGIAYLEVFGPDPRQTAQLISEYRTRLASLREIETQLVTIGISPHAPYTVADALYRASAELARSERLPMAVHIAESRAERRLVTHGDGDFAPGLNSRGIATPPRATSPLALLESLEVLANRPLLIHCVDLDAADVERIAAAGAPVAHCPTANARLGHGVAPVMRLQQAGVTVGLGTDSVGSNNRLDLLEEARTAALLQRAIGRSHEILSSEELLRMCTLDGARALGLEDRIGSLQPGKDADLCAVSLSGAHSRPAHEPLAALFHAARGSDVMLTMVRGRVLYREGCVDDAATQALQRAGSRLEDAARRMQNAR